MKTNVFKTEKRRKKRKKVKNKKKYNSLSFLCVKHLNSIKLAVMAVIIEKTE